MKTYSFILIALFTESLLAQGFYPLQKGNLWQYRSSDIQYPYYWETRVIGDTTLTNNKNYAVLTGSSFGSSFLRQEGSKVFAYSNTDSIEYTLFDFAAKLNDTICQRAHGRSTIVLRNKSYDSTSHIFRWVFVDFVGDSIYSYDFSNWFITDSIGLTGSIVEPGEQYSLTGAIVNGKIIGTITNVSAKTGSQPRTPRLYQNFPNPFNPTTSIKYFLPKGGVISISIFNILGQELKVLLNEHISSGEHLIQWKALDCPSGVYFCKIKSKDFSQTIKLLLLK
jgi:hypothetical protein